MIRYLVWYVDANGNKGYYGGHHIPYSKLQIPKIPYRGWNWYKSREEAEHDADLMRKDKHFYLNAWVSVHNT